MLYLDLKTTDPAYNLAVEEYVFECLPKDERYFMLWQNDHAVIIGKHQNTLAEINEAFIRENGIRVVRRLSGGGAVYHDLGNLNFTFITDAAQTDSLDFKLFCRPLVKTLGLFGVTAEITGRNDVTVDGKKISGNAQYVKQGRVMHHGTILFRSDLQVVARALQVNAEKMKSKGVQSARSRVTNVADYLTGRYAGTGLAEFRKAFLDMITEENHATEYVLTAADKEAVERIRAERYDRWEWNYGKSPACTLFHRRYFDGCGMLEAYLTINEGRLEDIVFKGDFFGVEEPEVVGNLLKGSRHDRDAYAAVLKGFDVSVCFHGLSNEQFADFITGY